MRKIHKLTSLCLAFLMIAMAILPITAFATEGNETTAAQSKTIEVSNYTIHNTSDNGGYYPSESNKVSTFCSGHTRLGKLKVTGDITKKTYKGYEAYAVYGNEISFEYQQTLTNKSYNGHDWKLSSDTYTSISGVDTGTIGTGGFLVMLSTDNGASWQKAATSVNINGDKITYSPEGSQIGSGVLLKFITVAEVCYTYVSGRHKDWKFWPFSYDWVNEYSDHHENLMQQTIVYVASDSAEIGIYSTSTDEYDLSASFEDVSPETLEILKRGTTLSNNSVSLDRIYISKLGNRSFDVVCSFNDSSYFIVDDGDVFTQPGKYHFLITTKFLTQNELDVFILDPKDDYAYSQYFGDSFVSQNKRVFDPTSPLPVHMVGTQLNVTPAKNVPGLCGHVYKYKDASDLETNSYEIIHTFSSQREIASITLSEPGIYCADLFAGDPNACGDIIHYSFYIVVIDNENYSPTVNYEMLTSADRHVMLKTSSYAVNYSTAGGGAYVFMFDATDEGYEAALQFSEEIEYRFIEEYDLDDKKYYYYKAHGTSGLKTRFDSKVELYAAVAGYAKDNVNLIYTNNTEAYATMTLDEAIANIENTSIRSDIKVCIDPQTRDKMVAEDIILNGYKFYQAADYESSSITATAEDGTIYNIPYNTAVESILPKTGRYFICESNWNASNTYYVTYIADEDVTGSISYVAYKNYTSSDGKIDSSSTEIEANSITLVSGEDKYDSQSIVTISRVGERKNMLLSEINNYTISDPGTYSITMTNRCGYTTSTTIKLTEAPKTTVRFAENTQWNRTIKYGEALGKLPEAERFGYVFLGWMADGELVTPSTICTWTNEVVLTPLFESEAVTVILNYFGGYSIINGKYGETIELPAGEDISGFRFGFWSLDGTSVEDLTIDTLDPIVLVANYYEGNYTMCEKPSTSFTADKIVALQATATPPITDSSSNDESGDIVSSSGDDSHEVIGSYEDDSAADNTSNDADGSPNLDFETKSELDNVTLDATPPTASTTITPSTPSVENTESDSGNTILTTTIEAICSGVVVLLIVAFVLIKKSHG